MVQCSCRPSPYSFSSPGCLGRRFGAVATVPRAGRECDRTATDAAPAHRLPAEQHTCPGRGRRGFYAVALPGCPSTKEVATSDTPYGSEPSRFPVPVEIPPVTVAHAPAEVIMRTEWSSCPSRRGGQDAWRRVRRAITVWSTGDQSDTTAQVSSPRTSNISRLGTRSAFDEARRAG